MSKQAVLIIDMVNDFVSPDGVLYCGEAAQKIIPYIRKLIETKRKEKAVIIYITDQHEPQDREFERFPPHCIKGTKGAEIVPELSPTPKDYIVPKQHFSAFFNTNLEQILKKEGITQVHIVGVCTSICIMETASDLCERDYEIYIHEKGVADFDKNAHNFALERMKRLFGARVI